MTGQLLTCALVVVVVAALTAATVPPVCPPGSHRSLGSGEEGGFPLTCQRCPQRSYMEDSNTYLKCKPHRECGQDEVVMVPGTNTSNVVCRCRSGGRHYHNVDDKTYGYDCRACTDGNVSVSVTEGMNGGDTACCPPGSLAFRTQHGHVQCRGPGESRGIYPPTTPCPAAPSPPLPGSSANEDSCQWKTTFIAAVIPLATALALAIAVIAFLIYLIRQRTRRTSPSEVEKLPLNLNT